MRKISGLGSFRGRDHFGAVPVTFEHSNPRPAKEKICILWESIFWVVQFFESEWNLRQALDSFRVYTKSSPWSTWFKRGQHCIAHLTI